MESNFMMPQKQREVEELPSLSYRQLQAQAKQWDLPRNFKRDALLEMIRARSMGDEERVERIIGEQEECRARRRAKAGQIRRPGRPRRDSCNERIKEANNNYERTSTCGSSTIFFNPGCSNPASIKQLLRAANVPNAATKSISPNVELQKILPERKRVQFSPEQLQNVSLTQHFSEAFSSITFNNVNGCVMTQNTPVDLSVTWNEKILMNNSSHQGEQWSQDQQWTLPPVDYSCPIPHAHGLYEEVVVAQSPNSDTLSAYEDSNGPIECDQIPVPLHIPEQEFSHQDCQTNMEIATIDSIVASQDSALRYAANTLGVSQLTDSAGLIMTGLNMVDQQEWAYYYASSSITSSEILPSISSILPNSSQGQQILPFNYSQP